MNGSSRGTAEQLRIRNEPSQDPEKHIPFSSRKLVECMQDGARRFGWSQRKATPGQVFWRSVQRSFQ